MRLSAVPSHVMTAPSHDPSTSLLTRTGPHASASDFSGLSLDVADSRPSHQLQNPPLTKWLIIGSVGGAAFIMAVLGIIAATRPADLHAGDAATTAQAAAMAAVPPKDPTPVAEVLPAATSAKATKKVAKKTEALPAVGAETTKVPAPATGDAAGAKPTTPSNGAATGKSTSKPATAGSKPAAVTPPAPSEPDFSDLPPPPEAAAPAPTEPPAPSAAESASEDAEAPAL